jgi:O-antigen/teichoic acid export membrane protein
MAYAIILMAIVITIALVISLVERLRQEETPFKVWRILGRSGGQ